MTCVLLGVSGNSWDNHLFGHQEQWSISLDPVLQFSNNWWFQSFRLFNTLYFVNQLHSPSRLHSVFSFISTTSIFIYLIVLLLYFLGRPVQQLYFYSFCWFFGFSKLNRKTDLQLKKHSVDLKKWKSDEKKIWNLLGSGKHLKVTNSKVYTFLRRKIGRISEIE